MDHSQHTPEFGLSRDERLRGRGSVSRLFDQGESGFVYPLRYISVARESREDDESSVTSVLFTVPKRFHKRANKRNLLRRRIKEAYRLQKGLIEGCGALDVAIIYSSKEVLEYDKISRSVAKVLRLISERTASLEASSQTASKMITPAE